MMSTDLATILKCNGKEALVSKHVTHWAQKLGLEDTCRPCLVPSTQEVKNFIIVAIIDVILTLGCVLVTLYYYSGPPESTESDENYPLENSGVWGANLDTTGPLSALSRLNRPSRSTTTLQINNVRIRTTEDHRTLSGKWKAQELQALKCIVSIGGAIQIATGLTALIVTNDDVHGTVCHAFAAIRVMFL